MTLMKNSHLSSLHCLGAACRPPHECGVGHSMQTVTPDDILSLGYGIHLITLHLRGLPSNDEVHYCFTSSSTSTFKYLYLTWRLSGRDVAGADLLPFAGG